MARSVIAGAPFQHTTLTFSAPGTTPGPPDEWGNPTWSPITGTLRAIVAPDRAAQLRRLEGADQTLVMVKGELIEPLTFPANVGIGSVLTLTWAGQAMKLTLTGITPNDIIGVAFGTAFTGEMIPSA